MASIDELLGIQPKKKQNIDEILGIAPSIQPKARTFEPTRPSAVTAQTVTPQPTRIPERQPIQLPEAARRIIPQAPPQPKFGRFGEELSEQEKINIRTRGQFPDIFITPETVGPKEVREAIKTTPAIGEFQKKELEDLSRGTKTQKFLSGLQEDILPIRESQQALLERETGLKADIQPSGLRTAGQTAGKVTQFLAAHAALGPLVEAKLAVKGIQLAKGGKIAQTTSKVLGSKIGAEIVKDFIISSPINATINDRKARELGLEGAEYALFMGKQMLIDTAIDAGANVILGKAVKALKNSKAGKKEIQEVAEMVAENTDIPKSQIDEAFGNIDIVSDAQLKSVDDILRITKVDPELPGLTKVDAPQKPLDQELILETGGRGGIIDDVTGEEGLEVVGRRIEPTFEYQDIIAKSKDVKAKSGFGYYTTDFVRNIEDTFKGNADQVKKAITEPFDDAKGLKVREEQQLLTSLKNEVVDGLGINKKSKLSSLTQQFGEKRISLDELVSKVGKADADKVVQADNFFRTEYDRLIDEVNDVRVGIYGEKGLIPKRADYYRHFKDLDETFGGLKNLFETPAQIDPQLAGISEFTKPNSKFLSFAQKRGLGKFKDDAVGGYLDYIQSSTFAKHIDPQIPKLREFTNDLRSNTSGDLNNFLQYMDDFTNDLAGKTNFLDRPVQKLIGRKSMKVLSAFNSRVKSNTVLGNLSSTISQIGNVPNAIATIKDPVALTKGIFNVMGAAVDKGHKQLYKQSNFLTERYSDKLFRNFDKRIIDQPKKLAAYLLEVMDEGATKYIWSSAYEQGVKQGIDPIRYADDLTRKMVAGRSIGEVPLIQKSKMFQMIAPFTIEVGNALKVQKNILKKKDLVGLAALYGSSFLFNNITEKITGNRILFDPVDVIAEITENPDLAPEQQVGRMLGELIGAFPAGSNLATLYPEFGIDLPFTDKKLTREEFFGENDPTRFGTGIIGAKGLADPVFKVLPSFGGGQIKKTLTGAQDIGFLPKLNPKIKVIEGDIKETETKLEKADTLKEQDKLERDLSNLQKTLSEQKKTTITPFPASFTKAGTRLRTPIPDVPTKKAKALLFGSTSIKEVRDFFDKNITPLGEKQTQKFIDTVEKTKIDPNILFDFVTNNRGITSRGKIEQALIESEFTQEEKQVIFNDFYGYK